jgi:hypothetical protein
MRDLFEAGTGRRAARIFRLGSLAGLGAGLLAIVAVQSAARPYRIADSVYWDVSGPPCAAASPEDLALIGRPLSQAFDFDIARFERVSGAAACSGVTRGGLFHPVHSDVCQFNTPRAVAVIAAGKRHTYAIEGGHPATVRVWPNGGATCVLAARFRGD